MQICCKPGGLEDKGPKTESGFCPKIMQKHSKLGSLEDQDPISKISKINFASWIRGFCRHLYTFVSSFFLKDQDPKTESRFTVAPRSCKYAAKQLVWRIRVRKLNLDLVTRSCK